MARKHLLHVKSSSVTNGNPKLPLPSDIEYGEIAINYADGYETISIKNSNNEIVTFPNSNTIEQAEETIAQALSDLDERVTANRRSIDTLSENEDSLENLKKVTYNELVSMVNESELVPGTFYRITDYVTTTTQMYTRSAGHQFDIVVLALSENKLSENASVMKSDSDNTTYFDLADLSAWEIKYTIKNDIDDFAWADTTDGKGVIFYMKDEYNNECFYDFKNIQFRKWKVTSVVTDKTGWDNFADDSQNSLAASLIYTNTNPYFCGSEDIYNYERYSIPRFVNIDVEHEDDGGSDYFYTFNGIKIVNGAVYKEMERALESMRDNVETMEEGSDEYNQMMADIAQLESDIDNFVFEYQNYDLTTNFQFTVIRLNQFGPKRRTSREIVYNNKIGMLTKTQDGDVQSSLLLPCNVFFGYPNLVDLFGVLGGSSSWFNTEHITRIASNELGTNVKNNIFLGSAIGNILEDSVQGNVFCEGSNGNVLEHNSRWNIIGSNSYNNVIGSWSYQINLGSSPSFNEIGDNSHFGVFDYESTYNESGNFARWFIIGGSNNSLGDECYNIKLIGSHNDIGDYVYDSTFYRCKSCVVLGWGKQIWMDECMNVTADTGTYHIHLPQNTKYVHVLGGWYVVGDGDDYYNPANDNNINFVADSLYLRCIGLTSNTTDLYKEVAIWNPADHLIPPASV